MNCDDKYNRIIENARIRRKLNEFGICSISGPTGPKGERGIPGQLLFKLEI